MTHEIRLVEGPAPAEWAAVSALAERIDGVPAAALLERTAGRRCILSCLAWDGGELAGYKIGYEDRPGYFESWIGGVAPEHRRRGIATALMQAQHDWCRDHGYHFVSTITTGDNRAMLMANLQAGFEVCGTFLDRRKILKVILQKHLRA